MKVVIPVADLHLGGGCKVIVDTAGALTAKGHQVEIVIPRTGTVKYAIPCKLTTVPSLTKQYIPYGDIVLPNFYTTFTPAYEAWPKQCVRLSLGFEPYWVPDRAKAIWTYEQEVPIISISNWLDRQIYEHVHRRSTVVSLGVDITKFHEQAKHLKIRKDKRAIILYIARDPNSGYELKGFNDFLMCMNIVKNEWSQPFVVYLICPEHELTMPGIPYRTFFPKGESEMVELYQSADVFVSSSWFEAFSLPPLEAMACGTPVVTTNSGGILDFCTHLDNAYIALPKNPRSLAQGICAVLSNKELSQTLVKGGRNIAKHLTKKRYEKRIVNVLERIYTDRGGVL